MGFVEMLKKYGRCTGLITKNLFPPVICKDGTFISAQASRYHHCYPQDDFDDVSKYEQFEVRTDVEDETLSIYKYDEYEYSCVDANIIEALIDKHGGLDIDAINKYLEEH